jgi:hypothetical protein
MSRTVMEGWKVNTDTIPKAKINHCLQQVSIISHCFHFPSLRAFLSLCSQAVSRHFEKDEEKKRGKNKASTAILCCTIINIHITYLFSLSLMCSVSLSLSALLTQSYFPLRPLIRHSVSIFSIKTYNIDGQFCEATSSTIF